MAKEIQPSLPFSDGGTETANGSRSYDVNAYLGAIVSTIEYRRAVPELKNWYEGLRAALEQALLGDQPVRERSVDEHALTAMLQNTLELLARVRTPFSGVMEFPQAATKVVEPYVQPLEELANRTRSELFGLARAIFLHLHPELEGRTVSSDDLRRHGFDDSSEPDADDYW